jgi:hypothetical protein
MHQYNMIIHTILEARGIVIRSTSELEDISRILAELKLAELARKIDEVNSAKIKRSKAKSRLLIQILLKSSIVSALSS